MRKNCFYIPLINLTHVKLNDSLKALCFGVICGYFETVDLESMLDLIDALDDTRIVCVDKINKVRLKDNSIVYRQRVYFLKVEDVLNVCKKMDFDFNLASTLHLSDSSLKNIRKDKVYLEKYAYNLNLPMETWLLMVFRYYCYFYLKAKNMLNFSVIDEAFLHSLNSVYGLLDRAPYFLSVCDVPHQKFVVLQEFDIEDPHLYTLDDSKGTVSVFDFGFTNINVLKDKQKGMFKHK